MFAYTMKQLFTKLFLLVSAYLLFASCTNINTPTSTIDYWYNLGKKYHVNNNDSIHYVAKVLDSLTTNGSNADKVKAYLIKGRAANYISNNTLAIIEYKKASNLLANNSDSNKYFVLMRIGATYSDLGNFNEALSNYYAAEKLATLQNNNGYLGKAYSAIAQVFQIKGDVTTAKIYLQKAIPLVKPDLKEHYNTQLTLANLYGMTGFIDSAIAIDNLNLNELKGKNTPGYESFFYNNKANCYLVTNKFDSAQKYFYKCLAIDTLTANKKQAADTYTNLVNLYAAKNDVATTQKIAPKAIDYCNAIHYRMGLLSIYQSLAEMYVKNKEYVQAITYKDLLAKNYKELMSEKSELKIAQLKVQFDTDKKEQQLVQHKAQIRLQQLIIAIALLLLLSILAFMRNYRKQVQLKKAQAVLQAKRNAKEEANKAIFETEQKERIRIARDLHDSIGQMLAYIKMQSDATDNVMLTQAIDNTITEVRNISHELMPSDLNFGLLKALQTLIEGSKLDATFTYNTEFETAKYTETFSVTLYRIIQELVNNTIKHAQASTLSFNAQTHNNSITLLFYSNGKPIDEQALEQSTGIGWQNIKARLALLNGTIQIDNNQQHNGAIITLYLSNGNT